MTFKTPKRLGMVGHAQGKELRSVLLPYRSIMGKRRAP